MTQEEKSVQRIEEICEADCKASAKRYEEKLYADKINIEKLLLIYALGWIVGVSLFGSIVWAFIELYK